MPKGELPASVIYARVRGSTVVIHTELAQGSGVVVGRDEIATNFHVIRGAKTIRVTQEGREWSGGIVVKADARRDLAIIRVAGLGLPRVPRRPFATLTVGERVYAVGSPEGFELTLSDGLISALRRESADYPIQISAPISHGSSGGGLFDSAGRLIGITSAAHQQGQNLNFAVPVDWLSALPVLAILRKRGFLDRRPELIAAVV